MYNNFSSKKTKKVISALLASALVVTSAPVSAEAATTKVLGVNKTFTKTATKVSGLSKSEKKIVKVTVNKRKKKVTVKGLKPGKASFKIGSKSYTVKVGAVAIKKKSFATSLTVGTDKKVTVTSSYGAKDTLKWSSSKTSVVKVSKATTTASAKKVATNTLKPVKAGTATITVKSKNTGKSLKVKVTVKAAETATATPAATATTVPTATATATATGGAVTTPSVEPTATATATATGSATTAPSVEPTATVSGGATTAPSADPSANPSAVPTATGTAVPTVEPVTTPAVTATPSAIEFTAKQTGDKKITITNSTLIKKEDITIKRGNSAVTIDKVDVDEAGTTAVITLAGSIVATEYTVAIGEAKVSFTGEASAVADIQITSEEVAMNGKIGDAKKGFANYAVYNQFGENITAKTSLVANTSANSVSLDPTNGIITIDWGKENTAPRLNDLVSVVLMYQNTGKSVSKMLKVATQAAPAEVEVKGVYNRDGKTLSATNVTGDDFYYLFRVKDQYGNYMTSSSVHFGKENTNMYITTAIGMTNVDVDTQTLQTITVDGVNYLGFPITRKVEDTSVVAGDITVMLIPGGSGKTVTDTITVAKGNTVTSLTITNPSALPSGGSVDLEYVALDENGDEVTNYRVLKEVKASDDIRFKWVKEDGKVVLRFTDDKEEKATTPGSAVSCVFTLPNYETRLVTISITDAAHTASIAGVDSKVSKATRTGDNVVIPVSKLNLQDQFGNSIGKKELVTSTGAAINKKYYTGTDGKKIGKLAVMVVEEDDNNQVFTATNGGVQATYKDQNGELKEAYILGSEESFSFKADSKLTGTENVTFKLVQYDVACIGKSDQNVWKDYETSSYTGAKTNNTQVGAFTTTLHNTVNKKFVSYDVNTIDTIYTASALSSTDEKGEIIPGKNNTAYKKNVEVKGVLSNGEKVDLTYGKDFKIVGVKNVTASAVSAGAVEVINAGKAFAAVENDTVMTVEGKYNVVINYTGDTIEKKVTVSRAAATTAKVAFVDRYTKKGVNISLNSLNSTKSVKVNAVNSFMTDVDGLIIKAEDTYGAGATVDAAGKVTLADDNKTEQMIYTISDIDTEKGKVTNNGTATPTFTGFEAGDSFKLTYTVGNATFSTIVSVQ